MKIRPARRIAGSIRLPGDKSISHRAALIAALATGSSRISNFSTGADCASTLSCLAQLGVSFVQNEGNLILQGVGSRGFSAPREQLDCGNSGSTIRMLAGILAGQEFTSVLTGDGSLRSRPMKRVLEPLKIMGAELEAQNGYPPLTVKGTGLLKPIRYALPVASAQVKTCVLLAALHARGRTEVIETKGATRDHTERMLRWFGVPLETFMSADGSMTTAIEGPITFDGRSLRIPGDISSAAFLIAAAALLPGSQLEIKEVGLNPTRTQFLSILQSWAMDLNFHEDDKSCNEPSGTVAVQGTIPKQLGHRQEPNSLASSLIPFLIDELPLLAVVGTQVSGGVEIRNAGELRNKETDRIAATVRNLRAMGAEVQELEDGMTVAGPQQLRGAKLESCGDHRIAMAFTIAALTADSDSEIIGAECAGISFPEFFKLLDSVTER